MTMDDGQEGLNIASKEITKIDERLALTGEITDSFCSSKKSIVDSIRQYSALGNETRRQWLADEANDFLALDFPGNLRDKLLRSGLNLSDMNQQIYNCMQEFRFGFMDSGRGVGVGRIASPFHERKVKPPENEFDEVKESVLARLQGYALERLASSPGRAFEAIEEIAKIEGVSPQDIHKVIERFLPFITPVRRELSKADEANRRGALKPELYPFLEVPAIHIRTLDEQMALKGYVLRNQDVGHEVYRSRQSMAQDAKIETE